MGKKMSQKADQEKTYELRYDIKFKIEPYMEFSVNGDFYVQIEMKAELTIRILDKAGKEIVSSLHTFSKTDTLENFDVRSVYRDLSLAVGNYVNEVERKLQKLEEIMKTFNSLIGQSTQ